MKKVSSAAMHRLFVAGVLALLAGCAATPISTQQVLTGQEGAVVLRMITAGGRDHPADTLSSITLSRQPAPNSNEAADSVTLVRTRAVTSTTAVFSGMVRPGRYVVEQARGSLGNTTYTFPMRSLLSSFEVRTGEVSLLGTLIVQPAAGKRFLVGYLPAEAELEETFEHLFPALAAQTRGKAVNRLHPMPGLEGRIALAERIKQAHARFTGVWQGPQGGFYAGGKLGKVQWRPAGERQSRSADVGGWREVLSLRPYRDGLLAAGEEGLLRWSADQGRTWTPLAPPDKGLIHTIEPMSNGDLVALVRRESEWTAYVTGNAIAGSWRRLASFTEERSLNLPWAAVRTFSVGRRVAVAMPNGFINFVDADTGAVERVSTGSSLLGAGALADGTLITQSTTMTRTTLMSTDLGKSWIDLNTSRFISAIAFLDRSRAYAVAPVAPGVFAGDYALMASRDGARTWARTGDVPGGNEKAPAVRELAIDRADGTLVALMLDDTILRSSDEGRTWTPGM